LGSETDTTDEVEDFDFFFADFLYHSTRKTPGLQLPFDPEKKTVVVLVGSGWGTTSVLYHWG
jgi:hypothetical protein